MKTFIAYFDFLGYKQFIENNDIEYLERRAEHILVSIGLALSQGESTQVSSVMAVPDISTCRVNCLNISDTIIFWGIEDTIANAIEVLKVVYKYNWQENIHGMPIRGCLIYDDFNIRTGSTTNAEGAIYSPNLIYGKGLLNAHLKTDSLDWAGTVIDQSFVNRISAETDFDEFISEYATIYDVPYKDEPRSEYAINLWKGVETQEVLDRAKSMVREVFEKDNKGVNESVERKISNTCDFIEFNANLE